MRAGYLVEISDLMGRKQQLRIESDSFDIKEAGCSLELEIMVDAEIISNRALLQLEAQLARLIRASLRDGE
jgi:hypothetical protein